MSVKDGEAQLCCSAWQYMPDVVFLHILSYLPIDSFCSVAVTCTNWNRVASDELLWKDLFFRNLKINRGTSLAPGRVSWRREFQRLYYHTPVVLSEVLVGHTDEVLSVNFSHDGHLFVTCSRDGFIKIWTSGFPSTITDETDMRTYGWERPLTAMFNSSDTLLLACGSSSEFGGDVAVFSFKGSLQFLHQISNEPYDVFTAWYSDNLFMSSAYVLRSDDSSVSTLGINKVLSANIHSEHTKPFHVFRRFNDQDGYIRQVMVSNLHDAVKEGVATVVKRNLAKLLPKAQEERITRSTMLKTANHFIIFAMGTITLDPHQIGVKQVHITNERITFKLEHMRVTGLDVNEANASDYDIPDHMFEMNGIVVGMALSPDQRYLFANVRPWPEGYQASIEDPLDPPPPGQDVFIHVIDLVDMRDLGPMYRSHKAFFSERYNYMYLDASDEYVASGAEDNQGYLWDREYRTCIGNFPHDSIVNNVAFNPCNSEMLVSVSDDFTIKIWRSRNLQRTEVGERPQNSTASCPDQPSSPSQYPGRMGFRRRKTI